MYTRASSFCTSAQLVLRCIQVFIIFSLTFMSKGFSRKALTLGFFYDGGVLLPFSISLLTIFIIPQTCGLVKRVFLNFFEELPSLRGNPPACYLSLLTSFILYHRFVILSRGFFHFFEEIWFYLHQVMRLREVVFFLPLTIIIILFFSQKSILFSKVIYLTIFCPGAIPTFVKR